MKIKMLFVAMVLFAMASVSHAQFNAILLNFTPLTDQCDGAGTPLGAGCFGTIYWDGNNNGPDAGDLPARIDGSPFGQANFNQIDMASGNDLLGIPGGFATDPAFTISTNTPAPSRYYVKVACSGVAWTSATFTIADGLNEYDLSNGWQCEVTSVPCNEPNNVHIETIGGRNFIANGPYYQCLRFCAGVPTTICLGPLAADEYPHVLLLPGCEHGLIGCDVQCPPASLIYDPAGWVYLAPGVWCNTVLAGNDGCACLCLDFIESAIDLQMNVNAGDSEVEVLWTTATETNMASYNVQRRIMGHAFETIASVTANNTTTISNYTFVDESADNGTVYEYTLQLVDINGSTSMSGTIASATPSVDAAVITEYALLQNYPNPFNPSTNLVFDVVAENNVNLTVYNAMGQEVASLVNGTVGAGRHTVSFDATNLTSGLYFYTVKIGNEFTATKKMLLVK
jgi:hypothetical protein